MKPPSRKFTPALSFPSSSYKFQTSSTHKPHTLLQLPPLLRLPPELRNEIYSNVFPAPPPEISKIYPPNLYTGGYHKSSHKNTGYFSPALLQVNRQLRQESFKIFFSNSVFIANNPEKLVRGLQALPREFLEAIRNIHLDIPRLDNNSRGYLNVRLAALHKPGQRQCMQELRLRVLLADTGINGLSKEAVKFWVSFGAAHSGKDGVWTADPRYCYRKELNER
ncbi:unnamed protein product [Zymoseptoria tritici ST99CH_3D1]|nr:unnamed protein product [Zymoseptoria tritici ST99CH_3D1]